MMDGTIRATQHLASRELVLPTCPHRCNDRQMFLSLATIDDAACLDAHGAIDLHLVHLASVVAFLRDVVTGRVGHCQAHSSCLPLVWHLICQNLTSEIFGTCFVVWSLWAAEFVIKAQSIGRSHLLTKDAKCLWCLLIGALVSKNVAL